MSDPRPLDEATADRVVEKPKIGAYRRHLLVCTGSRCTQDGASQVLFDSLGDKFKAAGLNEGGVQHGDEELLLGFGELAHALDLQVEFGCGAPFHRWPYVITQ